MRNGSNGKGEKVKRKFICRGCSRQFYENLASYSDPQFRATQIVWELAQLGVTSDEIATRTSLPIHLIEWWLKNTRDRVVSDRIDELKRLNLEGCSPDQIIDPVDASALDLPPDMSEEEWEAIYGQ